MTANKSLLSPAARPPAAPRDPDPVETAARAARRAQQRAGISVREIDDVPRLKEASDVFQRIWGKRAELGPPINTDLLRAFSQAGNYVAAAFDETGATLGALVGFLGVHDGRPHLHSHILGVLPALQARGTGFALKQHQRWWALARGLDLVEWTFDPLVRRNAYFNLAKLGGRMGDYLVNFYGVMDDAQNREDESDRILLRWELLSELAIAAAMGGAVAPLTADREAAVRILGSGPGDRPVTSPLPPGPATLLIRVPGDIVAMRVTAPATAREWRLAVREAMTSALDAGYTCRGMSRDGDYILDRGDRPGV